MDLIVRGGLVVDGTGRPPVRADVGIEGGRVAAIGDLSRLGSTPALDATGLVVAPGFVDVHSHSDFTLLVDPRAQSSIYQGVTTEVIGNCGHGCAPITEPGLFTGNIYGYTPDVPIDWTTLGGYLERLATARPAVNVVPLVPNGNLRLAVLGPSDRAATPDEVARMGRLLREGLDEGAFGYSTGLEYAIERGSSEEEVAALCRIAAAEGGIYATHTRNRDVYAIEGIEEAVRVAATARARLQVSHIIPRRAGIPDVAERALEVVDRARRRGVDVTFDAHTRLYGITNLSTALPAWAAEGGAAAVARRLRDPATRAALKREQSLISSFGLGGWDRVVLFKSERRPEQVGRSFAELAPPGGDPLDAVFDVLLAEVEDLHAPMCVCHSYDERQLRTTFAHPLCMVGSDATALAVDGPLARSTFLGAFTWAAWFVRHAVREWRDLSVEAAVHRLAALPAERLGLRGRGVLSDGAHADLIAFDPLAFAERGTLESPNQLAVGMSHVIVNGVPTLASGIPTGHRGGAVLRRI